MNLGPYADQPTAFCYSPMLLLSSFTVRYVHRNQCLLGTGEWRWGKREIIYLSLHFHHQNDCCFKMGSGESHFNVSLIVRDKVIRQCPQTTTFDEKGEPKRNRAEAFLLTCLMPYAMLLLLLLQTLFHRRG